MMKKRQENVSREELYERVWNAPMVEVAKDYGVSDVMLAKVCKGLRIPCPGRGHWAKVEAKKAPARPPLPPAEPGEALEWARNGWHPKRAPELLPVAPAPGDVKVVKPVRRTRHPV